MALCLSHFVESPERALARARAVAGQAVWLELRLDRAPEMDFRALVESMPLPVIAACPLAAEGGDFPGSAEQRDARLREAAAGGARFVDVPLGAPRPADLPHTTHLVHSWHEQPGEQAELRKKLHEMEAQLEPGDVTKVVSWAEDHADSLRVLALYGTTRASLVAFAQGPGGRATRAWAPALGAPWTYACSPGEATAPGQWSVPELTALFPPGGANHETALYGVVGRPIAHSRSPLLWNLAIRLTRLNAFYLPLEVERFDRFLHGHRLPSFQGFSVTAPFKVDALAAADSVDASARAVGAANTLQRTGSGWRAWNTDGPAALDAFEAAGARAGRLLVLGAGGAARAAAHEALQRGWSVQLAARRRAAAEAVASELAAAVEGGAARIEAAALEELRLEGFTALAHATPVGGAQQPGNLLAGRRLDPALVVLDMVYAPARTALLAQAAEQGCTGVPGHEMLVRQMQLQFRLLTGTEVPGEPLRRTVQADLERA